MQKNTRERCVVCSVGWTVAYLGVDHSVNKTLDKKTDCDSISIQFMMDKILFFFFFYLHSKIHHIMKVQRLANATICWQNNLLNELYIIFICVKLNASPFLSAFKRNYFKISSSLWNPLLSSSPPFCIFWKTFFSNVPLLALLIHWMTNPSWMM